MTIQDKDIAQGRRALLLLALPLWLLSSSPAAAENLTIGAAGRVSIELISSEAAFRNTLSVISPNVAVPARGCRLEPANGLPGPHVVSEKVAQRGCRVALDSDPNTAGIQPFGAGTTFEFGMCAQTDADPDCEFVWSSDPGSNSDGVDHVITTELYPAAFPGQVYRLAWEDRENGSNGDFNDLIVVVRVERDSDGDGLWDDWERFGIDTDGNGTIDLNLPALGANPLRKDVFLEIDWMDCAVPGSDCSPGDTHTHRPLAEAVNGVIRAFANANVSNPDGSTGINLHIDLSNAFAHRNALAIGCVPGPIDPNANFNTVKADPANFGPFNPRRFAYHYALFAHFATAANTNAGCAESPGNDFEISIGGWPGGVGAIMQQAGVLMHELGHNLGLGHGGADNLNFKPNHLSIMNYRYEITGIPPTDPDGAGPLTARLDYSRQALPTLDELRLNEPAGVGDGTDNIFWFCPDGQIQAGVGNTGLDWSCDGDRIDPAVNSDVNRNGRLESLPGSWDWAILKYDFQATGNFEDSVHLSLPEEELDLETYEEMIAPELAIAKTALPATVLTGSNVTYTITVTDQRPEQATEVRVSDLLPSSMSLVSCAATGGGTCGGTGRNVTVDFPVLPGGNSAVITLAANVSCSVADGTVISNTAITDFSQPDPDPSNNSATVKVTASNPPPVISGVATDKTALSPPNHKMVDVTVSYKVTDNCGVPVCRLAVTSNEPVDGPGSGSTSPDWEILDEHHVRLRAERSGTGRGRLYTIGIACKDDGGAITATTTAVTVPR